MKSDSSVYNANKEKKKNRSNLVRLVKNSRVRNFCRDIAAVAKLANQHWRHTNCQIHPVTFDLLYSGTHPKHGY
jgi:hypothetical protein